MSDATAARVSPVLGWSGFVVGAAALLLALMTFWSGPFGAQPVPIEEPSLVERMTDAARGLVGGETAEPEPAAPVPPAGRSLDEWLFLAIPGLGGLAVILGLAGFARNETRRPAFSAVTLGGGAIVFQLVTGFILVLICLMLFGTLTKSGGDGIGDIFSGILEAIGGFFSAVGDFFGNLFSGFGS